MKMPRGSKVLSWIFNFGGVPTSGSAVNLDGHLRMDEPGLLAEGGAEGGTVPILGARSRAIALSTPTCCWRNEMRRVCVQATPMRFLAPTGPNTSTGRGSGHVRRCWVSLHDAENGMQRNVPLHLVVSGTTGVP